MLGARPYGDIPSYLQHADVLVVPHAVNRFTESLDPIKAREIQAVGRPAVSTAVAGFRDLGPPVRIESREGFVESVVAILADESIPPGPGLIFESLPTWSQRAEDFHAVLIAASERHQIKSRNVVIPSPEVRVENNLRQPKVEVLIVAYGDPMNLERALDALGNVYPTLVVDNSSDSANAAVTARHGARYLDPGRNLGFSAAVNRALAERLPKTDVLLLNPDAIIKPQEVELLRRALHASADIAAVAPSQRVTVDAPLDRVCWPFPSPWRAWENAIGLGRWRQRCDFLIGSVLLLRADALIDIGGFDERFFLYAEETDWQRRAQQRGWRVSYCEEASAVHVGAASDPDSGRREIRFHAGLERYVRKWYGRVGWASFRVANIVGATARAVVLSEPARSRAAQRARLYSRGPEREALRTGAVLPAEPYVPSLRLPL
jgi:GT2 family glycosyltransferase